MSGRNTYGGQIAFGDHSFVVAETESHSFHILCRPSTRDNRLALRGFGSTLFQIILTVDKSTLVRLVPHRRRRPINLRQFRERDGRELREVIANLHAGRNLERDTPRFGRGNGKVTTDTAQSGTC